jgi:phosphoribosylcarboxyaminoimidazole (NCAIR) mutase
VLALTDKELEKKLADFRRKQTEAVKKAELPKP